MTSSSAWERSVPSRRCALISPLLTPRSFVLILVLEGLAGGSQRVHRLARNPVLRVRHPAPLQLQRGGRVREQFRHEEDLGRNGRSNQPYRRRHPRRQPRHPGWAVARVLGQPSGRSSLSSLYDASNRADSLLSSFPPAVQAPRLRAHPPPGRRIPLRLLRRPLRMRRRQPSATHVPARRLHSSEEGQFASCTRLFVSSSRADSSPHSFPQWYAYGELRDYSDHANCLGWIRMGDDEHDGCVLSSPPPLLRALFRRRR